MGRGADTLRHRGGATAPTQGPGAQTHRAAARGATAARRCTDGRGAYGGADAGDGDGDAGAGCRTLRRV